MNFYNAFKQICPDTGQIIDARPSSASDLDTPTSIKKLKAKSKNRSSSQKNRPHELQISSNDKSMNSEDTLANDSTIISTDIAEENSYSVMEIPKSAPLDQITKQIDGSLVFQYQDINGCEIKALNPTDPNGNTILEKCIQQYEIFFEVYLSHKVLRLPYSDSDDQCDVIFKDLSLTEKDNSDAKDVNTKNKDLQNSIKIADSFSYEMPVYIPKCSARLQGIDKLFDTLKIHVESRSQNLQHLLNRSLMTDTNNIGDTGQTNKTYFNSVSDFDIKADLQSLLNIRLTNSQRRAIKLAINLLVEMSTFPHCTKNIAVDKNGKK